VIPNVVKGADMGHLVRYLLGPGEANEHSDPHLVAGSATLLELHGTEVLDRVEAPEIAAWLDGPRRLFGTDTTVSRTVRDAETGAEKVIRVEEHVWHCSLAVRADAGMLGDGSDGKAPCRWVAVHHGRSENGNDHVHVVVGMVREDGTKWSPYRDFKNAQKACRELEARYEGLTPVTGPVRGIGERGTKPAEAARAKATGAELTVPQELAVKIRAAAVEATGEAEFVRRLRGAGVIVKPRYAEGSTAEVTGYSVMLPTARTGGKWVPYAGGKLGRDLSLPELRTGWGAAKKETPPEAATEWRAAHAGAPVAEQAGRETRALHPAAPGAAAERLARMNTRLATLASGDQATPKPATPDRGREAREPPPLRCCAPTATAAKPR
jgi:hypothetical protein